MLCIQNMVIVTTSSSTTTTITTITTTTTTIDKYYVHGVLKAQEGRKHKG